MKSEPDELDLLCARWASVTRREYGLENPSKQDDSAALASLQAVLPKLIGRTGPSTLNGSVAVLQGAMDRMPRELAHLVQLHYLLPSIPARLKARFFELSPPAYYARLDTATAYLRGYLGAARVEMAEGGMGT